MEIFDDCNFGSRFAPLLVTFINGRVDDKHMDIFAYRECG